ncbi:MAG: chorismate synthase [Firmicutes bacterium]|nr:chorismate synthase [Bacillota bacterium]
MRIELFGESHGKYIGAVVSGFPCGIKIDTDFIKSECERRRPNGEIFSTNRNENDEAEFISGINNGFTSGAPVCFLIKNKDVNSADYNEDIPRPSHADYTASLRYKNFNEKSGGGHFSGRLTAPYAVIGALAKFALNKYNIKFYSKIDTIGKIKDKSFLDCKIDLEKLKQNKIPLINDSLRKDILELLEKTKEKGDSVGAKIECIALNVPKGLGGYRTLQKQIAEKFFLIPAVKAVEFGLGVEFSGAFGSQVNDGYNIEKDRVKFLSNNSGGSLGGITTGEPILAKVTFKPTPSIFSEQNSVNLKTKESVKLNISGRHDPCVALRALPVLESVMAIEILELMMEAYGYVNF